MLFQRMANVLTKIDGQIYSLARNEYKDQVVDLSKLIQIHDKFQRSAMNYFIKALSEDNAQCEIGVDQSYHVYLKIQAKNSVPHPLTWNEFNSVVNLSATAAFDKLSNGFTDQLTWSNDLEKDDQNGEKITITDLNKIN